MQQQKLKAEAIYKDTMTKLIAKEQKTKQAEANIEISPQFPQLKSGVDPLHDLPQVQIIRRSEPVLAHTIKIKEEVPYPSLDKMDYSKMVGGILHNNLEFIFVFAAEKEMTVQTGTDVKKFQLYTFDPIDLKTLRI